MSTQEDILVGATPVIAFALGGIWQWLRQIHRVLVEIKLLMITDMTRNSLPEIKDRIR